MSKLQEFDVGERVRVTAVVEGIRMVDELASVRDYDSTGHWGWVRVEINSGKYAGWIFGVRNHEVRSCREENTPVVRRIRLRLKKVEAGSTEN